MPVNNFKELRVWQAAMDLAVKVQKLTDCYPKVEQYGIVQQIRRAAVSVPSNIAEGFSREHLKEYFHHLSIAQGSLSELETQIILSNRLNFINENESIILTTEIEALAKQLRTQRISLQRSSVNPKPQTQNSKPE